MLELINVSYLDGDRRIVDTVDLEIEAGSVVVLLGPRGAGKTTLLRLISGELEPTSGFVVRDPRVSRPTILDEPGDDPKACADPHARLALAARMAGWGVGVVAVVEDVSAAALFADRVLLMRGGQIVADGLPSIVLQPQLVQSVYALPCRVGPRRRPVRTRARRTR
jgi:ABC-type hemin transport system ATPase subunit